MIIPLIYMAALLLPCVDSILNNGLKTDAHMLQNPNITIRYKAAALWPISLLGVI